MISVTATRPIVDRHCAELTSNALRGLLILMSRSLTPATPGNQSIVRHDQQSVMPETDFARLLVRFDHVASFIVNANHDLM